VLVHVHAHDFLCVSGQADQLQH